MLIVRPGVVGNLISLNDALRSAHEVDAQEVAAHIEKRKKSGLPLSDDVDFEPLIEALGRAQSALKAAKDGDARDEVAGVNDALATVPSPMAPFEPDPELEGVKIKLKTVSRRRMMDIMTTAIGEGTMSEYMDRLGEIVKATVAEVHGLREEDGSQIPVEPDIELLEHAGLLPHLARVGRYYQELTPEAKKAFGSGQP